MVLEITTRQAEALLELLNQNTEFAPMRMDLIAVQTMLEHNIGLLDELTQEYAESFGAKKPRAAMPEA